MKTPLHTWIGPVFLTSVKDHRDFLDAVYRLVRRASKGRCSHQSPKSLSRAIPKVRAIGHLGGDSPVLSRTPIERPIQPGDGKATDPVGSWQVVPLPLRAPESLRKAYRAWTSRLEPHETKSQECSPAEVLQETRHEAGFPSSIANQERSARSIAWNSLVGIGRVVTTDEGVGKV